MRTTSTFFAVSMVTTLFCLPGVARAHAFLDHADPKVGSTIATSPTQIRAWFTQEIEPAFSALEVRDSQGKQLDAKDTHADDKDAHELILSVPKLPDGEYTVKWNVVSVDTHHTQGSFKFTVKSSG